MTIGILHRLAKIVRTKGKRSFAVLNKFNSPRVRLWLFAAALLALACAAETKAVLSLETSQALFGVIPDHGQTVYR
jgi:hypothetical protein